MAPVAAGTRGLKLPAVRAPLILASASPRRAALLRAAGWIFEVLPGAVDETPLPDEGPRDLSERLARAKARAVGRAQTRGTLLAADTVVALDGRALGKPRDRAEARAMLAALGGRRHEVHTAVALLRLPQDCLVSSVATASVAFDPLDGLQLERLLEGEEWRDKAGAYAIQGLAGACARVEQGGVDTVIGLPLELVGCLVRELDSRCAAS